MNIDRWLRRALIVTSIVIGLLPGFIAGRASAAPKKVPASPKITYVEAARKAPLAAQADLGEIFPADTVWQVDSFTRVGPRQVVVGIDAVNLLDDEASTGIPPVRVHTPVTVYLSRPKSRRKAPGHGKRAFYRVETTGEGQVEKGLKLCAAPEGYESSWVPESAECPVWRFCGAAADGSLVWVPGDESCPAEARELAL